jgi:DNA polymerase-3 subunit alpha
VGPGRGSAAGSLVSYAMEITDIDPLEYGLLFERFLNPERISMPDIDIDFLHRAARRSDPIRHREIRARAGGADHHVRHAGRARTAIKDVGRVLDIGFADVDRITKLIPTTLNIKLKEAMQQEPAIEEAARKDPR